LSSGGKLPTLTTARQAHSLSNEEAARALPVHLRGVVTYFDPDFGTGHAAIFIHDATGSIFVSQASKPAAQLFAGALVDVRGVSSPGGIVGNPQIHILGRAPLPLIAPRVSLAHLKTGAEDAQWVEVEGSVHDIVEFGHGVLLRLEMSDGPIMVLMMKTPGAAYSQLVDSVVRIRGNAAPSINSDGQIIDVHLQAPNLSSLQVVEPAPGDPFARPIVPIDKLLTREYYSTSIHRIHLRGHVTLQWPGSLVCIRDGERGICAETRETIPAAVGDLVDVAGFVETDDHIPVIANAVFRSIGNNRRVAPQSVTADKVLDGGFGSELIQVDGLLVGYDLASSDAILQLSSGDTLFPAILPKSLAGSQVRAWKVGSRLRVTGISLVSVDIQNNVHAGLAAPKSFRILMRSPADVTLLERPSWWTPAHALILLGLALACTLGVLVWVVILRKRVQAQSVELRKSEQRFRHLAQHDSLTGLASRLILEDRLKDTIDSISRNKNGLAMLMVDLDRFKEINDTFGHQCGDEVLRVTARRLLDAVRTSDTVVRLGGDEFVVLLSEIRDARAAELVASTVVSSLSRPVHFADKEVPVTVSVGVETAFASEMDIEALMRHADAALYRAKNSGRNCFQVFAAGRIESLQEKDQGKNDAGAVVPKA
jgi:diguanylate cyclase (GGDEF)-like protein